jgi:hypothetical protein
LGDDDLLGLAHGENTAAEDPEHEGGDEERDETHFRFKV